MFGRGHGYSVMNRDRPSSTVRSELQSVGRELEDFPRGEEAQAQALQSVMPWLWLEIGIAVAAIFACLLMVGQRPASQATPTQSVIFNTVGRHH